MGYMFAEDIRLKTIYVSELWSTAKVTKSTSMFSNDSRLPNYSIYNEKDKTHAYYGGDGLGYLTYKAAPTP